MKNRKSLFRIICMPVLLSLVLYGCGAKGDVITGSFMYKTNETRGIEVMDTKSGDLFLIDYAYEGTECVLPIEFMEGRTINWLSEGGMSDDSNMQSLVIPDCYEGASLYSLNKFPNLKTIWIGSGLSYIEAFVFAECPNVESVTVSPDNPYFYSAGNCIIERETDAVRIGFACSEIPEGVKKISTSAFISVGPVHTITLPSSLTEIEPAAFFRSTIETMTIPNSVVRIGDMAFNECDLQSVYIPSSVTEMGEKIFYYGEDITIYCEAESQPESWNENWLEGCENPTVVWGYLPKSSPAE